MPNAFLVAVSSLKPNGYARCPYLWLAISHVEQRSDDLKRTSPHHIPGYRSS